MYTTRTERDAHANANANSARVHVSALLFGRFSFAIASGARASDLTRRGMELF
jgi:hypothetical protein